jgi:hypothetical protein
MRGTTQMFRTTFSGVVTASTLADRVAVVRLRIRLERKKQATDDSGDTTLRSLLPGCSRVLWQLVHRSCVCSIK